MPLYEHRRARRSLFDTIAYRILSQVSTVCAYVLMVRAMSKEDFGIFNLLYSFIPLVGTVASLGLEQALRRFQPEYLRQGGAAASAWLVSRVAALRLATNLVILTAILLAWNHLAPRFGLGPYRAEFSILCVLVLFYFQSLILQLSMASHMLHRYSVGSVAMLSFAKLLAYALFAFLGVLNLRTALISDTTAYALVYVFLRVTYRRQCLGGVRPEPYRPAPDERKRLRRYALFNNFNDAGSLFLDSRMDNFFVAAFLNPVAVGIYAFYVRLNEMATNILPARLFENIIQPMFFAVPPAEAQRRLPQYFTFLLNTNLLLQWPLVAFAVAYHAELVHVVFGGKYMEQSWLLPLIMAFSTINCFATPVTLVAQYEEKTHIQLLGKMFAVYNVLAMPVLIPLLGLYGAALASGSAQALKNLFVWWHVRRNAVWLNAGASLACGIGMWGAAAGLCCLLKRVVPEPALLQLVMGLGVFGAVALLYARSPALSASDRELLQRLFQGRETPLFRVLGLIHPVADASRTR